MFSSMLSQVSTADFPLILFLGFLETILSVDNALVLALMVHHLPGKLRSRALTYGLIGAVISRLACLTVASYLMQWPWIKFLGGGYLTAISIKHFVTEFRESRVDNPSQGPGSKKSDSDATKGFWTTVLWVELMDLAFAVDSILAATAISQKIWVVFVGGMIGVLAIRFAANGLSEVLDRFPSFERTAYLLILWIGVKLFLEGFQIPSLDFHSTSHSSFWVFWGVMVTTLLSGFVSRKGKADRTE